MDLFVQLRAVVFRHFCAICASLHTVFHLRLCDTYMYVEREREKEHDAFQFQCGDDCTWYRVRSIRISSRFNYAILKQKLVQC